MKRLTDSRFGTWIAAVSLAAGVAVSLVPRDRALAEESGRAAASDTPGRHAQRVTNFMLLDYHGRSFELRRSPAKVVVLYFTGFGCPIALQSIPKLQKLQEELGPSGVEIWLVNAMPQKDPDPRLIEAVASLIAQGQLEDVISGRVADPEETRRRIRAMGNLSRLLPKSLVMGDRSEFQEMSIQARVGDLALLRDERQSLTRQLNVTRTCDAIAIDTGRFEVVYRGALDDQMVPGAQKPAPTRHYLADALRQFLDGRTIELPSTPPQGCLIAFSKETLGAPFDYAKDVAPLLIDKCVRCHSSGHIGPFALGSHEDVVTWSAMIEEVVMDRRMPPWDADPHFGKFKNDSSLTAREANGLIEWIHAGSPRGDSPDPLAVHAAENAAAVVGWRLGEPDQVVPLPDPQQVPATGVVDYRYVTSRVELAEDRWLRAIVCRPGEPRVVHHVIVRAVYPPGYTKIPNESYLLSTWAPGVPQSEFPADTGVFLPRGTRFNFELHYTTNGQPHVDQTELGLYFASEPPKMQIEVRVCETRSLRIPPHQREAQHRAMYCFKRDAVLYDLGPHMHRRGSRFRFQLLTPDGARETLLSVPRFDFNWQVGHRLAEPLRIPAGSWMICEGAFDNSSTNPANPDATRHVHWGLQTSDEMFMGFMTVAEPREEP